MKKKAFLVGTILLAFLSLSGVAKAEEVMSAEEVMLVLAEAEIAEVKNNKEYRKDYNINNFMEDVRVNGIDKYAKYSVDPDGNLWIYQRSLVKALPKELDEDETLYAYTYIVEQIIDKVGSSTVIKIQK